jgi:hypothetical protein
MQPAATHHLSGCVGTVQIPAHKARGTNENLPWLASRHVVVLVVDHPDLHIRTRLTNRSGADHLLGEFKGHRDHGAGLGQSIGVDLRNAPALDQVLVKAGGNAHLHGQLHLVVTILGTCRRPQQQARDRTDAEEVGDVVSAYDLPESRHAELSHYDQRAPGVKGDKE